ncbi:MAG: HAD-IA family hydrolase [Verrucomicrobia bacterium]|nr:HAD-IA family hydrolase [Verrucomicrobiota bacterium]
MPQPNQIRAVVFDMDGVLTDSEPLINEAAVRMFHERGLAVQPEDFLPFIGTGEDRYLGGVAEKYRFPLDLAAGKRRTYEIYLELVPARLQAFPGAVSLVQSCRAAGLKVAVASSADRIKIEANLRKIGLPPDQWDALVCAEDVKFKKPAADIFLAAAAKLQVAPSDCVVIEDAVNGVQAAKAAGMRCVAVAQSFGAETLQKADLIKARIADVSIAELKGDLPVPSPPLHPFHEPSSRTVAFSPLQCSPAESGPKQPRGGGPRGFRFEGRAHGWEAVEASQEENLAIEPWGFWASLGLTLVIGVGVILTQVAITFAWLFVAGLLGQRAALEGIESNGLFLAVATCATAPVAIGLAWVFAAARRTLPVSDYLGLKPVTGRALFRWSLALGAVMVASDGLTSLLGRPIVPEFMRDAYQTAGFAPLLWLAVIVAAPLGEETLFRGFLFQGLAHSRIGGWGAILLTSAVWAAIHLQYDLYGMATIFVAGLLLGYARLKTGSLYAAIFMHALMNLIATIQVAVWHRLIG